MFELSVAGKYLTPRWRQLSVSIISTVSILVIALVVWLIIVFFSVTDGLEKGWVQKLIALTAPIRITPTEAYKNSYYYQIDSISSNSDYSSKSIREKLSAELTDPYDPQVDEELPAYFKAPDREADGSIKDIVKKTYHAASNLNIPGLRLHDFEMTVSNLRLRIGKSPAASHSNQSFLSQMAYLGSFDEGNATFLKALLPVSMNDLRNILVMSTTNSASLQEDHPEHFGPLDSATVRENLTHFFQTVKIRELKTPPQGWILPRSLYPNSATFHIYIASLNEKVVRVIIPQSFPNNAKIRKDLEAEGYTVRTGQLVFSNHTFTLSVEGNAQLEMSASTPLTIEGDLAFPATLVTSSITQARLVPHLLFDSTLVLQGTTLTGQISLGSLLIAQADHTTHFEQAPVYPPAWLYFVKSTDGTTTMAIPSDSQYGEGILLPKSFRDAGALLGDRGTLSYYAPTTSSIQEQRIPVFVAGFYDPGIIPIGGKYVLANSDIVNQIKSGQTQEESLLSNGINVRFTNLEQADEVKAALQEAFKREGIDSYWHIETYREFDFTKDLIQQLRSEKNLWSLIATIIIIVACSNIISMLIILVNDKKTEIGILRSMGASAGSIALIFGFCGVVMGLIGSLLGTVVAVITLKNLQGLIDFISRMQGHEVFNPVFYGSTLPNEISYSALLFVIITTALISLLAGIVPAIKASLIRPATILKAE
jgi:lipoprotein-releasing system permease protein